MKRTGRPPSNMDPIQIGDMLARGMNFRQIRAVVKCGHKKLKECIARYDMPVEDNPALIAARLRSRTIVNSGLGGDALMGDLMRGRTFDRLVTRGDGRPLRYVPHTGPGDDFSGCGSSFDGIGSQNKNPSLFSEVSDDRPYIGGIHRP